MRGDFHHLYTSRFGSKWKYDDGYEVRELLLVHVRSAVFCGGLRALGVGAVDMPENEVRIRAQRTR